MKMTGENVHRQVKVLFLACVVVGLASQARAQDITVTNLDQLAQVALSGNYSFYLPFSPCDWRAYPTDYPLWCDFTQMSCLDSLPTATNLINSADWSNVPLASVSLMRNVLSGVTTVESSDSTDVVATIAAPYGYQPYTNSADHWLWDYYVQATNNPDWWGLTPVQIPPPIVTLQTYLVDSNAYYSVYESNLAAEAEESDDGGSGGFSPIFGGGAMDFGDDGGDPCLITNFSAPFNITSIAPDGSGDIILQWPSCTNAVYVVQTAGSLPASLWTDVAWMFGSNLATTWTDTNAVGLTQNFYQVTCLSPYYLNYEIPAWWAVENGFDPLDPNLDLEDPTGDGYTLLEDYVNGTNPNVSNTPPVFIINNGNQYTTTLSIPIRATSTNYPKIRVWLDTLSTNVTLVTNTGATFTYTIPDEGDGTYGVYAQYANTNGVATSQPYGQSVTLDRAAPVITITAPASNTVLNQAFMTLAAAVYDPGSLVANTLLPLSIWINGQPYWDRAGTNLLVERFPVPTSSNSFTVTIRAVNEAGLTNAVSQTWTVNTSTATNAPNLLSVNLSTNMLLPNVNSIWVEGGVDNDYAFISAIVSSASGAVTTNSLPVWENYFQGSVPLASGTNQLVLLASDAKGNASSNTYTVISSTELSGAITNPVFGVFATAPSNYVSGYVSALYDAGLPTQTSITNVTINGVAAVLGTNVDAYGNVPFWTTNMIPLGVPITSTIAGPGIPTDPPGLPPMESQGYEVTGKETGLETIDGGESGIFNLYWGTSSNCWSGDLYQEVQTYDYAITNSSVQEQFVGEDNQPSPACLTVLNPDQITWLVDSDSFTTTLSTPINTSLSLGINGYMHGEGEQFADVIASYNPTNDTCTYQNETEGMRSLTRERDTGWVTFRAPWQPATNTTVVLTFQGLSYATPNNATPDLSQVLFRGQSPVSNDSESASYLMTVSSGQQYTINQDDFTWPSAESQPGNYATTFNDTWDICPILKSFAQSGNYLTDYHWLTWTAFTNHSPVHILWTNGVDITGTSGNSIIVGQQVNLTATVDTPGIATSNFTWSVSGSTVSNYIIASGSSSAQAPPLTQTNGASVAFYWVSGGQQNVSCSVLLNNGSVATSQASFAVQRPQQQITTANLQPSVDSDYSDPEQPAPAYLHLGNRAGTPGITFTRGGSDTLYGGSNYWSQVIVSTTLFFKLDNATCLQFSATNSLDQQNPYDSDQSATEDSPGVALLTNYVEVVSSNNFCMWLMYVPPGTNSIPVPSRALNWNWSGDAIFTNSSWEMRSGAGVASASSDSQTNGFPTWTGIVTGGETASPVSCPP